MKFSGFFLELKINFQIFICAQVTWRNLEHPIDRDQRSKAGDDMALHGPSDRTIKSRSSIIT